MRCNKLHVMYCNTWLCNRGHVLCCNRRHAFCCIADMPCFSFFFSFLRPVAVATTKAGIFPPPCARLPPQRPGWSRSTNCNATADPAPAQIINKSNVKKMIPAACKPTQGGCTSSRCDHDFGICVLAGFYLAAPAAAS